MINSARACAVESCPNHAMPNFGRCEAHTSLIDYPRPYLKARRKGSK